MKFKLLISLFVFFFCTILNAQNTASLRGKVTDSVTGDDLPGANIVVSGTAIGDAADIYGNYVLKNVPAGEITIRVSYIGYRTIETKITTSPGKTTQMDFKLNYESIEGEEVIVTAQAKGQTEAINQQLSSKAIVNVVSSARIQEIPDANAAESVGRLPGVSILRSGGEGNKVVIRGLAPKFNNVQVAGIKMAATDVDNRSVDLSMISPYMLEGIEVTKAITPDMDADAIGGTVNFKLKEAQPGLKYDLLLQGGYNDLKDKYNDHKIVASGSNRFFDGKLGVFAQIDIEQRNRSSNTMGSSYAFNRQELDLQSLNLSDVARDKSRYGGTLVMDYQIPSGSIILNNFFSVSNTDTKNRNEDFSISSLTHTYTGAQGERKLNVLVNSLNYTQDFPVFKIDAQISHSYSEQKSPDYMSLLFIENAGLSNVDRSASPYDLPKAAVNNYHKTVLQDVYRSNEIAKDREIVGSLNLSRNFNLFDFLSAELKTGGKYSYKDRMYDLNSKGGFLNSGSGQDARDAIINKYPWMRDSISSGSIDLPYTLFMDYGYTPDTFLKGRYTMGPAVDFGLMRGVIDVLESLGGDREAYRWYDYSSNTNDYSGNEYYYAGYVMADFQISNLVKVIVGARYEELQRDYTAVAGDSEVGIAQIKYDHHDTTTSVTQSHLLPMVHIKYKPFEWFDVRFAYTNTLSRPDFRVITPRYNIGSTISYNNWNLKPAHSENFDLYLSFHDNTLGLFTTGAFKKTIFDMIFATNGKILLHPEELGLADKYKLRPVSTYLNNETPVDLWGLEFSWQTHFWYLPGLLNGLVLDINYTHINSEAKYPRVVVESKYVPQPPWIIQNELDSSYTARMISQPNDIVNVSLGYDYKGFSIRGSMLFQSDIFSATNFYPELRENTDDFLRWDLSVKQELPWEGLQFFVNVANISGEIDRNIIAGNGYPSSEEYYGRNIDLGFRYRLK
jgi:TonB-dependent receptor